MSGINLTDKEREVFDCLLSTIEEYKLGSTIRAAGGWVRDKLLGLESDDIDIAVDNMSGEEFALKVQALVASRSEGQTCSRVGVVKQNPDQSKHLATACFTVCGVAIDVNNLRTETYTEDSRIPTVSLGTPEEDAFRRDFTLNALFYNINADTIEDFVHTGVEDLRLGLIRTPLPAKDTFQDDPLRVLRAIRFAARFGFELHAEIQEASKQSVLHEAIIHKISRERVGVELEKMLSVGQIERRVRALEFICEFDMYDSVFNPPAPTNGTLPSLKELAAEGLRVVRALPPLEPCDTRFGLYAAMLCPLHSFEYGGKKPKPLIHAVLRNSLKLPNMDSDTVPVLASVAQKLVLLVSRPRDEELCVSVGNQIRLARERWPLCSRVAQAIDGKVEEHAVFRKWIEEAGISDCWNWRPFFDGQILMKEFGVPKGKKIGELIEKQFQWRLRNPRADEAAMREWLPSIL